MEIVDFTRGIVGQNGVFHGTLGHGTKIPNESLTVVTGRANVTRRMWRPGNGVEAAQVSSQFCHGQGGHTNIQYNGLATVHLEGGQIVGVLLVPFEP